MKLPIVVEIKGPSPTHLAVGTVSCDQGRGSLTGLVGAVTRTPPVSSILKDCGLTPLGPVLVATAGAFARMDHFCATIQEGQSAAQQPSIPDLTDLNREEALPQLKIFPAQMQPRLSSSNPLLRLRASLGHTLFQHLQLELEVLSLPPDNPKEGEPPRVFVAAGVGVSVPHIGIVSYYQAFGLTPGSELVWGARTFICLDTTNPEKPLAGSPVTLYRLTVEPSQAADKPHCVSIDDDNGLRRRPASELPAEAEWSAAQEMGRDGTALARRVKSIAGLLGDNFDRVMVFLGREKGEGGVTIDPKTLLPPY